MRVNMSQKRKIAIIGTGISGLSAASIIHPHHEITVFEKNDYIGGHSRTVDVHTHDGVIPVDTGFIVFNKRNYPLLTRLFDHLQVLLLEAACGLSGVAMVHLSARADRHLVGNNNLFSQLTNLIALRKSCGARQFRGSPYSLFM